MLPQPPDICLISGKTGAVDSRLLSSADTDCLTILDIANRVGLGILQCDQRNHQITLIILRDFLLLSDNILEHILVNFQEVMTLFKCDAEHLLPLQFSRTIGSINLNDIVSALSLGLQNFQCLRLIARRNDTIRNLTLNHLCGWHIADIRQRNEIAIRGHAVCPSCTCISTCQRRKFS